MLRLLLLPTTVSMAAWLLWPWMETDRLAGKDQGAASFWALELPAATISLPTAFMVNYSRCGIRWDFQLAKWASLVLHPETGRLCGSGGGDDDNKVTHGWKHTCRWRRNVSKASRNSVFLLHLAK